jgi:hypothetical protein
MYKLYEVEKSENKTKLRRIEILFAVGAVIFLVWMIQIAYSGLRIHMYPETLFMDWALLLLCSTLLLKALHDLAILVFEVRKIAITSDHATVFFYHVGTRRFAIPVSGRCFKPFPVIDLGARIGSRSMTIVYGFPLKILAFSDSLTEREEIVGALLGRKG